MDVDFFKNIFTTQLLTSSRTLVTRTNESVQGVNWANLIDQVSKEEVNHNLFFMDPIKSPDPNGIQPVFFLKYWEDLGDCLTNFCISCFDNAVIPKVINESYITLIPKVDNPESMSDFRPIGLCNTIYKLITKIISSRIRPVLSQIVSPLQSSFIKGRGIEDNVIVVKEVAHLFHK